METRQIAEQVAEELNLSVAQVAKIMRTEHKVVQEKVAAGERVVLTGFLSIERTKNDTIRTTAGTTFNRVLRGGTEPIAVSAPAVRATTRSQMTRGAASPKSAASPAKKATAKKTPAKKTPATTADAE